MVISLKIHDSGILSSHRESVRRAPSPDCVNQLVSNSFCGAEASGNWRKNSIVVWVGSLYRQPGGLTVTHAQAAMHDFNC